MENSYFFPLKDIMSHVSAAILEEPWKEVEQPNKTPPYSVFFTERVMSKKRKLQDMLQPFPQM